MSDLVLKRFRRYATVLVAAIGFFFGVNLVLKHFVDAGIQLLLVLGCLWIVYDTSRLLNSRAD